MRRSPLPIALALLAVVLPIAVAHFADAAAGTGGIRARVVDDARQPLAGVRVTLSHEKGFISDFADSETAIRSINEVAIDRYLVHPLTPPEDALYPALTDLLEEWQCDVRLPAMVVKGIMNNQAARIRDNSNLRHAADRCAFGRGRSDGCQ